MTTMLINASDCQEIRVAIVNNQVLDDFDLENMSKELCKGNLYWAEVENIEFSLNAAFVYYGAQRRGFLPLKEVAPEYWSDSAADHQGRRTIKDVLKVGQKILVQVDKDERGSKGAALTTFITLAGCYLVLMPNNPRAGGISRRVEGEEREELKDALACLEVPEGMGIIIRTAGVRRAPEELQWDLAVLLKRWEDIQSAIQTVSAPTMIHQERDIIARAIRDHLHEGITEIIVDNPIYFEKAKYYMERLRPEAVNRLKLYTDKVPLFSQFQIESQIESAFDRTVTLPSGGSIVIDHTEAVVTIDINSARSTRGGDIEETALHTNIEAAREIARQLRLRDLSGLIVIDFIDMTPIHHQREVENELREALKMDRARVQIGRISRFGLLEMSRQRLRSSLSESIQEMCPRCEGQGHTRSIESLSLSIIRLIEEQAIKDNTAEVHAALPIEVATFLANEKRSMLIDMELRHGIKVLIMPVFAIQPPHYQIRRVRQDEKAGNSDLSSFEMAKDMLGRTTEPSTARPNGRATQQTPVVEFLSQANKPREPGLIQKSVTGISQLFKSVFKPTEEKIEPAVKSQEQQPYQKESGERSEHRNNAGNRGRYGRRRGPDNRKRNDTTAPREFNERRPSHHPEDRSESDQAPRIAEQLDHHIEPHHLHTGDPEAPAPIAREHNNRRGGRQRRGGGQYGHSSGSGHPQPRQGSGNRHPAGRSHRSHQPRRDDVPFPPMPPMMDHDEYMPFQSEQPVKMPSPVLSYPGHVAHESPSPAVIIHQHHETPAPYAQEPIAPSQRPAAPKRPAYRPPLIDSPLMKSAPLQDVTQMNADQTSSHFDSEDHRQDNANSPRERTGQQRRYPRRRPNHLRTPDQTDSNSDLPRDDLENKE